MGLFWWGGRRFGGFLLGFLLNRTRDDVSGCPRKVEAFLRPGAFGRVRLLAHNVAAIDDESGDLPHGKAEDRSQDDGNDANVTEGFHAARPSDLLRSENAWAAAATALAADSLGASGSAADAGRAAITILDSRLITLSPSASCFFSCCDSCSAEVSWLPRFSLTSRTVCLRPPLAPSPISVPLTTSALIAFSECSSAFRRFSRLFNSMQ